MAQTTLTASPFAVFRRRDFSLLFGAQFVSSAGSGLTTIAASILVFQLTGSAWSVGLLLIATALPNLLIGLTAGVFVDRLDPRRVMLVAQLLRVALVGAIPLLMRFGVAWVYVLVMLSSAVESFFGPAQASVLPETASDEELAAANALMTISDCAALTLGFAGAGLLAGVGLIAWAFWLDALSFLAAAGCIALLRVRGTPAEGATSVAVVVANLREGLAFVRDQPVLRSLFLIFIPVFALFGFENALLLPFAERVLGASELEYGLLEAVATIGFVLGGLVLVLYTDRLHAGQWVAGSFLGMGLVGLAFALSPSIWPALILNGLHGLLNTPSYVGRTLIIQRNTPREARGRVTSTFTVVRDACFLLGMGAAGLGDLIDVRLLLLASSAVLLSCGLLALSMPGLGRPSAERGRVLRMLRTALSSATPGLGRAALPADVKRLAALLPALGAFGERQLPNLALATGVHAVPAGTPGVRRDELSDATSFLLEGRTGALAGAEPGRAGRSAQPRAKLRRPRPTDPHRGSEAGAVPQTRTVEDAPRGELLRGKRILFVLGSYPGKRKLYERARQLGVRMSVVDGPGHWCLTAPDLFERVIVVDLAETATILERTLAAIAATGAQFDAVATFEEAAGALAAGVAQHLGLPGHPLAAIEAARHKAITRRVCLEAGIPTPRFALVRSAADLEAAAARVGFPAVLKPASGMSSFAVYRVDTLAELRERYAQTQAAVERAWQHEITSDNEPAMVWAEGIAMVVEEYLDGEEFDVDCLMSAGELVYAQPVRDLPQPYMVETGTQIPPNYPQARLSELVALTRRVLVATGFRNGAFHVELKDTSQGPRLIEVNARIGGGPAWELHRAVWGVDLVEQYLLIQIGVPILPLPARTPQMYCITADLPAPRTGTVTGVNFLDHLARHPNVVRAYPKVVVGQRIVGPDTGVPEWMGEVVVRGESSAAAEAAMTDILASIELPIAPEAVP